jgi:hypothetical protein
MDNGRTALRSVASRKGLGVDLGHDRFLDDATLVIKPARPRAFVKRGGRGQNPALEALSVAIRTRADLRVGKGRVWLDSCSE